MDMEVSPAHQDVIAANLDASGSIKTNQPKQTSHPRLAAMIWIVVAWIVGTLVFEVTATGADLPVKVQQESVQTAIHTAG